MVNCITIYDPVPFTGGSKIAVKRMLATQKQEATKNTAIYVLTLDKSSWQEKGYQVKALFLPRALQCKSTGFFYYIKQCILLAQVIIHLFTHQNIKTLLAISGPGVDWAGLMGARLKGVKSIQIIQGPIAFSRLARLGFGFCHHIFYLESMDAYLDKFIVSYPELQQDELRQRCRSFVNGLDKHAWPAVHQCSEPRVFWAASLLKWKGLDIFQRAISHPAIPPEMSADVCYILPRHATSCVLPVPANTYNLRAWNNPLSLDDIRRSCSIFVSTADQEPFGLSILEAMAAGLCPVIPADGAYWDQKLTDGVNCVKYSPQTPIQLAEKLAHLAQNMDNTLTIGRAARELALMYSAQECYREITNTLELCRLETVSLGQASPEKNLAK